MTNGFNFLIYKTPDKDVKVNAVIKDDTIWLTQKSMAELFGCSSDNISLHLKNIFEAGELKSYFDPNNGWVCIGELSTFEDKEVIEFARNTIVVLKDGEIISLWLKPTFE